MKYIYIICLALSSFFTYKSLHAQTEPTRYAFFIPGSAFGKNTDVPDINLMRPRYAASADTSTADSPKRTQSPTEAQAYNTRKKQVPIQDAPANTNKPRYSQPYERKKITVVKEIDAVSKQNSRHSPEAAPSSTSSSLAPSSSTVPTAPSINPTEPLVTPPPLTPEIAAKINQYQLDDTLSVPNSLSPNTAVSAQPELSALEKIKQKNIQELFADISYPDSAQPEFKQRYALYALELRVLRRRGKFPLNPEQDKTLAKANSLRRFEVK